MNKLNRILLIVLGVQVLLVLLLNLRGEDTTIGKLEPLLAGFAKDKVERVRIFDRTAKGDGEDEPDEGEDARKGKPGEHPAIELVKKGNAWVLASHFDYPVDDVKVSDLVDKIEGMRSRGPIASGTARQRQLEVADDGYARKVVITAGGSDVTIYLGASAGSRQTSVRVAGQDTVHGVTGLSSNTVAVRPNLWVDSAYIDVAADKIASFDVVNGNGTFHFERSGTQPAAPAAGQAPSPPPGDEWQASIGGQPVAPPAGMEINRTEISKVANKASKIYLNQPSDPERAVDKPLATVTLRLKPEAPEPAAGADAGAVSESTLEQAEERVIEIAAADQKDRYYVREKGRQAAILVEALSVTDLVELSRDRLVVKKQEKKPGDEGAQPAPGELPMEGLPPGMDPGMMGQP